MVYGRMTNNFTVILVNVIGCSLQTTYIVVYFMFAAERVGLQGWEFADNFEGLWNYGVLWFDRGIAK